MAVGDQVTAGAEHVVTETKDCTAEAPGGARRHNQSKCRKTKVFKGSTDDMKDNVFQCYGESPDKRQFTKTVDALAGYIAKNMDYPKDVTSLCKKHKLSMIREPVDLTDEEKKAIPRNSFEKHTYKRTFEGLRHRKRTAKASSPSFGGSVVPPRRTKCSHWGSLKINKNSSILCGS